MLTGNVTTLRIATGCSLVAASLLAIPALACPALDPYNPQDASQWPQALQRLRSLEAECLQNADYYALLGAGQLETGQLPSALESLERALLLDPDHAPARIDYAEALYLSGQLFAALELNRQALRQSDVPPQVAGLLRSRQQQWRRQTSRSQLNLDLGLGYDSNLNGGPARNQITLTLSGEALQLTLDEAFQSVEGPYGSLRLSGLHQRIGPEYTHDFIAAIRSRNSEHTDSDLLQLDWRYNFGGSATLAARDWRYNLTTGTSHLLWGGNPLYSVLEGRLQLRPDGQGCRPLGELAAQQQQYHGQSLLSGLESGASLGLDCRGSGRHGVEAGYVRNDASRSGRPGGDREGWRLRFYLEQPLWRGSINAQLSLAGLDDRQGYSELLADNARRSLSTRMLRLQYRQPLQPRLEFTATLNHQQQASNLSPFNNDGTAFELGLSYQLGGN